MRVDRGDRGREHIGADSNLKEKTSSARLRGLTETSRKAQTKSAYDHLQEIFNDISAAFNSMGEGFSSLIQSIWQSITHSAQKTMPPVAAPVQENHQRAFSAVTEKPMLFTERDVDWEQILQPAPSSDRLPPSKADEGKRTDIKNDHRQQAVTKDERRTPDAEVSEENIKQEDLNNIQKAKKSKKGSTKLLGKLKNQLPKLRKKEKNSGGDKAADRSETIPDKPVDETSRRKVGEIKRFKQLAQKNIEKLKPASPVSRDSKQTNSQRSKKGKMDAGVDLNHPLPKSGIEKAIEKVDASHGKALLPPDHEKPYRVLSRQKAYADLSKVAALPKKAK